MRHKNTTHYISISEKLKKTYKLRYMQLVHKNKRRK